MRDGLRVSHSVDEIVELAHIAIDLGRHKVGLLVQLRLRGVQGLPAGNVVLLDDILHSAQSACHGVDRIRHERRGLHNRDLHLRGFVEGALVQNEQCDEKPSALSSQESNTANNLTTEYYNHQATQTSTLRKQSRVGAYIARRDSSSTMTRGIK